MKEPAESAKPVAAANQPAPSGRNAADAAAWKVWDRAAERLRDVGAKVRDSDSPLKLEADVALTNEDEGRIIARNTYTELGAGDASVVIYDAAGARLASASIAGVTGR